MKKIILLSLVFLSVIILVIRFSAEPISVILGIKERAGIRISSKPDGAKVFINDAYAGKTPFSDDSLDVSEYKIKVQSQDALWEGRVKLKAGTLTVVNRELSSDPATASGELLTLEKGQGVTVLSSPTEADVEVDGKSYGKTPVLINIEQGEHTFILNRANYLKRSIKASVPPDYNLTLSVDLALSEADLTNVATEPTTSTPKVIVKNTPTGFLRVREKPSISAKEIAQVKPKDELVLLEETDGWFRVRLADGKEGYISATYADKKN